MARSEDVQRRSVSPGGKVTLRCPVQSYPLATVTWTKDGTFYYELAARISSLLSITSNLYLVLRVTCGHFVCTYFDRYFLVRYQCYR